MNKRQEVASTSNWFEHVLGQLNRGEIETYQQLVDLMQSIATNIDLRKSYPFLTVAIRNIESTNKPVDSNDPLYQSYLLALQLKFVEAVAKGQYIVTQMGKDFLASKPIK